LAVSLCGNLCTYNDNSFHVVTGSFVGETAVLDGFTITGGHSPDGNPISTSRAGGIFIEFGAPTITNCTFRENAAGDSGAADVYYGNATFRNCTFSHNFATFSGGAMKDLGQGGGSTLVNCTFRDNKATIGGAMEIQAAGTTLVNCLIQGNTANGSAGITTVFDANATFVNSVFIGNTSTEGAGGGLYNAANSTAIMFNCTFAANSAPMHRGGGIYTQESTLVATNCILWGNSDSRGTGESSQISWYGSAPVLNYSCIQGLTGSLGGTGNIGADPLFVDPDGADNVDGTEDDDVHLGCGSPCIDAANNTAVPSDRTDLDADGNTSEPTPLDFGGDSRFKDDPMRPDTGSGTPPIVDMGAYEFQPDCNANGLADDCDLDCLGGKGACNVPGCGQSPDCNANGIPDECELAACTGDPACSDCNANSIPDGCEPDCNSNAIPDDCDIAGGISPDADSNGIPDECESGACCDGSTGFCVEDVAAALCTGDQHSWSVNTLCKELDPPCTAHPGACCDLLTGICTENVPPSLCLGTQRSWSKGATCNEAGCEAVSGACCDNDPFGGCTDGLTRAQCNCTRCEWTKLALCNDVQCSRESIPTVGAWGLAILTLLLLTGAKVRFGRLQQA
jgi:hypothetical protein